MNTGIRIKSLNGDTYTETVIKDGKTFINVYDEDGNLIDVMEEVASYFPSKDDDKMRNEKKAPLGCFSFLLLIRFLVC